MSTEEDAAARLVAQMDQAKAMKAEAGALDAKTLGAFFKELRDSGMTEEQAFAMTNEWMVLTLSVEESGDEE